MAQVTLIWDDQRYSVLSVDLLTPELFDVAVDALVIVDEPLLPLGALTRLQEILDYGRCPFVLIFILQTLQCTQIPAARILEGGNG